MDITLWIELRLFVCLMALSGFFSSSETSLFSLSRIQLEQMRRDGHANLNRIERLLSQSSCRYCGCAPAGTGTGSRRSGLTYD